MRNVMTEMEKEEVKLKLRQQLALFSTQELLTKMTEKCFKACIQKPGTKLTNYDQPDEVLNETATNKAILTSKYSDTSHNEYLLQHAWPCVWIDSWILGS